MCYNFTKTKIEAKRKRWQEKIIRENSTFDENFGIETAEELETEIDEDFEGKRLSGVFEKPESRAAPFGTVFLLRTPPPQAGVFAKFFCQLSIISTRSPWLLSHI